MSGNDFFVPLSKVVSEFSLEGLNYTTELAQTKISSADINRPGLQLGGFFEYFDPNRIQIIGNGEKAFIDRIPENLLKERFDMFFAHHPVAVVVTRGLPVLDCMRDSAERHLVPLLRSTDITSTFMSNIISFLNVELAPRETIHGVLVEVYGEGVLLLGESGVGKSETAIELVKRGHRLIADDAVEIRRVSNKTLVGSSPENIRHFVELRGVGIINARRIFGMGAVKPTEKIDLMIEMEPWDSKKVYERMGIDDQYSNILGINVPSLTIPIKPGRNLAIIIEVAAMNNRQKKMGYNATQELLQQLGMVPHDDNLKTDL